MRNKLYVFAMLVLLLPCLCMAQEFRATITGIVTDQSGAAVPNATVIARSVDTNDEHRTSSSGQGNYTLPLLRPGVYVLTAEAPGFKKFNRENLTLQVGQNAGINISLEVGQMTESVNVTA
jgi:hypothetical protein